MSLGALIKASVLRSGLVLSYVSSLGTWKRRTVIQVADKPAAYRAAVEGRRA
jgi:hypothetical protein